MERLALFGGPKAVKNPQGDVFTWPIITEEDERAVLEVLRAGKMSERDVTAQFETEFANWHGVEYALAHNTGTAALHAVMFGCGVGVGDEIIAPSLTFWASVLPAMSLGATIVFADVEADTMCIDPKDVEGRITKRTKAIVVVHSYGYPADMDPIVKIAGDHGIKVIEDVSHAHGGLYKGRILGTIGHAGAMSCMSGKALAIGEGGMLITNDREIHQRATAFGHYQRTQTEIDLPELVPLIGLPLGGTKYRMHQMSSAMGRVQLKHYGERLEVIRKAMNAFWDLLEGVPGIRAHRPAKSSSSKMGGWYLPHGIYCADELGGLGLQKFADAVRAEGGICSPGANPPLHLHPVLNEADIYGHGKPTRIAHADRDVREGPGSLPVTESIQERVYGIPWFKKYRPDIIAEHAEAYRKVAEQADKIRTWK